MKKFFNYKIKKYHDIQGIISSEFYSKFFSYMLNSLGKHPGDKFSKFNIITKEDQLNQFISSYEIYPYVNIKGGVMFQSPVRWVASYETYENEDGFVKYLTLYFKSKEIVFIDFKKYFYDTQCYNDIKNKIKKSRLEHKLRK